MHQHHITPGKQSLWLAIAADDLHGVDMDVKGMIHHPRIHQVSLLDVTQSHPGVDALMVVRLPVDQKHHPPAGVSIVGLT
jgi:hypothetical protein